MSRISLLATNEGFTMAEFQFLEKLIAQSLEERKEQETDFSWQTSVRILISF